MDVCKHMLLCHCVFSQLIYRYALSLRVFTANIQICSVTGQSTFCFASLGSEDLFQRVPACAGGVDTKTNIHIQQCFSQNWLLQLSSGILL